MKKKSQRLQPVQRLAEGHEQRAARELGAAQQRLDQARRQLAELVDYRADYRQRFRQAGAGGMGAAKLVDFQHFLLRLDQAIEQQTQMVAQAGQELEGRRAQWFASRGKVKALDGVAARYVAEEQRDALRREQREQDDRTQHTGRSAGH